jgi:hypothetical protein
MIAISKKDFDMKKLIAFSLSLFMLPAYAAPLTTDQSFTRIQPAPIHTVVRQHSSLDEAPQQMTTDSRTTNYPTQIVRFQTELNASKQTCDEVLETVDAFFSRHITYDKFFYNTINFCTYDPKTSFATKIAINSYFDPLDEEAVEYLKQYLAEHHGRDLLGKPFYVEEAQALIVSLDIDVGIEDSAYPDQLLRIRTDNASHYFKSNYDMRVELIKDVRKRFFSNQPSLVLPFIDKWFLTSVGYYDRILRSANYVELRPELIFLMNDQPKIFTPMLRLYYGHHCSRYENKHCLM